jgi:hypothetical protein
LCSECRAGKRQVESVRAEVIDTLRQLANCTLAWDVVRIDRSHWGEVRGVLNRYVTNLIGRRPRMHEFLG